MAGITKFGHLSRIFIGISVRSFSSSSRFMNKGLVLGAYQSDNGAIELTPSAQKFNDKHNGHLLSAWQKAGLKLKPAKSHVLHAIDDEYTSVAVVGLGSRDAKYCTLEERDERRENIRTAVGAGVRALRDTVKKVAVDACGDAEAAGEGASLSLHVYDELKDKEKRKPDVSLSCYDHGDISERTEKSFQTGCDLARGQNVARRLMEMPANYLTPTLFVNETLKLLGKSDLVKVTVREKSWMEEKKMGAFLSVTRGSAEPPKFLEIEYKCETDAKQPFALIGKGVTFDSGGISIKSANNMDKMRADMGGAACVIGTIYAFSLLRAPGYIKAFIPLCENMPSGTATKPGDVVIAMNGKSIQVDNTDAEGRLILADAYCYAASFQPTGVLDMATLTGSMVVALGSGAAGVFTNSTHMWNQLHKAGGRSGDRLWRMPLWKHYTKQVTESVLADVNNVGTHSGSAGCCTAAAFLKEFSDNANWIHIDIAGVAGIMENQGDIPYLGKGMSGRPTRTIVEFLRNIDVKS